MVKFWGLCPNRKSWGITWGIKPAKPVFMRSNDFVNKNAY